MPDWFYRTVSQPILFRLSAPRARDLALGFMGRLARFPPGPFLIDFLGHMRADERLRRSLFETEFPTAVGLGPWLDQRMIATEALSRFGVGFIEIGPVTLDGTAPDRPVKRIEDREALWFAREPGSISLAECNRRLSKASGIKTPLVARLGRMDDESTARVIRELSSVVRLITLSSLLDNEWTIESWSTHLDRILNAARSGSLLLCVTADQELDQIAPVLDRALEKGVAGFVVDGSIKADDGRLIGLPAREAALQQVRQLRERFGPQASIIASGGVHEPEHALELIAAGADLIQVDTGLIYTGPGLPKRINDCLLFEATRNVATEVKPPRTSELTWFWTMLMGTGMLVGGLLALAIAATKVVLPYDEAFLGMSAQDLAVVNSRLLAFMAHDRVTLAGVMVAIGLIYITLSVFGIRRGLHWARQSVLISAFTGFISFFLFLGFGYLDTFHAFVTTALLQLLLLGVHAKLGTYVPSTQPDLRGDSSWRTGLWGQLLLVFHGFALLAAGVAISLIGITQVFVHEDLHFMQTTAESLASANPRLVPLVAHDRATLGGMLLASGWVFLLPVLWGFRRNSAWLWWSLLIGGSIAYAAAIAVHYAVGYLNTMHLLPAFAGFALMLLGLILSYPFLCRKNSKSV